MSTPNVPLLGHKVESAVRTGSVEAEQYLVDMSATWDLHIRDRAYRNVDSPVS